MKTLNINPPSYYLSRNMMPGNVEFKDLCKKYNASTEALYAGAVCLLYMTITCIFLYGVFFLWRIKGEHVPTDEISASAYATGILLIIIYFFVCCGFVWLFALLTFEAMRNCIQKYRSFIEYLKITQQFHR